LQKATPLVIASLKPVRVVLLIHPCWRSFFEGRASFHTAEEDVGDLSSFKHL